MPLNLFHNSHNNLEVMVQRCLLTVAKGNAVEKGVCEQVDTPGLRNRNKIKAQIDRSR